MITVADLVQQHIQESPFLETALSTGLINTSALARQLQPQLEAKLLKPVSSGAILMALQRLTNRLQKQQIEMPLRKYFGDMTVRSQLTEYTFRNSPTLINVQVNLLKKINLNKRGFINLAQGIFETTFIMTADFETTIEKLAQAEQLIAKLQHLSAITLCLSAETVTTPGVYYPILKALAWEGINLIEIISVYSELTIIFEDNQVERAFHVLKKMIGI